MPQKDHILRIIGGNWRSRKVSFPAQDGIRPTPDRVRETVFNWLQSEIAGAHCLDLYAGSGILSMEALSRGASHVSIVDKDPAAMRGIGTNLERLGAPAGSYSLYTSEARAWLANQDSDFDIVFLDPPFDSDDLPRVIDAICLRLRETGLVYVESPSPIESLAIPASMVIHRQKRAGQVCYGLLRHNR